MKKILVTLLLSVVLLFMIDKVVYATLNYFYKRTYVGQDGGEINRYLADNNKPSFVIMGSSTARFQVSPDSFNVRGCNLAHHSTTDCFQLALLHLMIQKKQVPKSILLAIYPGNYIAKPHSESQTTDILFLKYYYHESFYVKERIDRISSNEWFKFLSSSYRFNGMVLNTMRYYALSRHVADSSPYYFKYQQSTPGDSANVESILKNVNIDKKKKLTSTLSPLQTSYLPGIITLCKQQNIKLMAYYMPMLLDDSVSMKPGLNFADSVLKDGNIPYFKFTQENASNILTNYNYWSDGQHINQKGGALQSQILANFVRSQISISNKE